MALQFSYNLRPLVDLDLIYNKVKFTLNVFSPSAEGS